MIKADINFIGNLREILNNGCLDENPRAKYKDGTPAHTKYITQVFETYDLEKGEFPITTLRNTAILGGIKEIYWIYSMQSNDLDDLAKLSVKWWDDWNIGDSVHRHIGERYGKTIKNWGLMDKLLNGLKNNPFGRRHIINMWQEADLRKAGGLDECAYETIWSVRRDGKNMLLDMTLIQRSSDYITAGYINKIQYVALQMMVAAHCGYGVGKFSHMVQNLHIYDRHIDAAQEILSRSPKNFQPSIALPYEVAFKNSFYDITPEEFVIDYAMTEKLKSPLELAI